MSRDYRNIVAWQRGHELTLRIYRVTKEFPADERYGLTSQLRRAMYGVPSNIVEGSARDTKKDYLRFLFIALASLKEAEYFLLLAHDLGYLSPADHNELTELVNRTFAALDGLIKAVRKEVGPVGALWATLIAGLITALGRHLVSI